MSVGPDRSVRCRAVDEDQDGDGFAASIVDLDEHGVMFTPGDAFDIPRTVRIGFADDTATLTIGLEMTSEFLRRGGSSFLSNVTRAI